MMDDMEDSHLERLVKHLNQKHYHDIVTSLDDPTSSYNQTMEAIRSQEISMSAWQKDKTKRLLAVLTPEQDHAFTKAYGANYYRDPNFFKKHFPQTLALAKKDL